ncbi:hypothetical protein [Myxococcus eversor]|uniref:hypothetical protein n=1 Tax=Myxococcus eversor TaxID=2709661 RepID=UPI0013D6E5CC|nr:hypothetical protein [Myxococcus eversor]
MSWRGGWMVSLLVVGAGCGGALPEEESAASSADVEQGLDASYCLPTEASTQRVKAILPPSELGSALFSAGPGPFEDFRGTLHFAVNFEDGRRALWKSDGTEAGTLQVKSLPNSTGTFWPVVTNLTATPSRLFFMAGDSAHGMELWASDGTGPGTALVKDLTPGPDHSSLSHLTPVDDALVFFKETYDGTTSPSTRYELWRSDGTSSGTVRLRDFGTEMDVSYLDAKAGGALLFFVRELSGAGTSLWKTDGTTQGTVRLKKLTSGAQAFIRSVESSDESTLFILGESSGLQELWKTDGTAAGTVRLASFGSSRVVEILGALGSWAYVTTTSVTTQYMVLYRVPLAGGNPTSVVSLPNAYASQGVALPFINEVSKAPGGSKLFFSVHIGTNGPGVRDTQLWVTDGTAAGTTLLRRPMSLSDEYGAPLVAVSDDLVFFSSLEDGGIGVEPWVSNGTPGGTRRLKNISTEAHNPSSYPYGFLKVGSRVFFGAYDETRSSQLWSTALSNACVSPDAGP